MREGLVGNPAHPHDRSDWIYCQKYGIKRKSWGVEEHFRFG